MSVKDNFFFIDSDNLESVDSKLYGFCIADAACTGSITDIIEDREFYKKTYNGCFTLVQNTEGHIYISQDFIGCYGIYLFRKDNYFAVSNSFLLLVENIKSRFQITANREYMEYFMQCVYVSYACAETLVNEIEMLPRYMSVIIDKKNRILTVYKKAVEDEILEPDSSEGMETLDNWYYTWTNFIRNLSDRTDKITVDLSGGKDSRLVFLLFLCSGIDLGKIRIHSSQTGLHTHSEDYEIARMMAKKYSIRLNKGIHVESVPFSLEDTLALSFYTKLGFCKEIYFKRSYCIDTVFAFTGGGGESIRGYDYYSMEETVEKYLMRRDKFGADYDFAEGDKKIIGRAEKLMKGIYGTVEGREFGHYFSKQGMARHHFGKAAAEQYLANNIQLSPLLDLNLHKIRQSAENQDLLIALIFTRYCPELLNFKFDSGHVIDEKVLKEAGRINGKYPFKDSWEKRENFSRMNIYYGYKPFAQGAVEDDTNKPEEWCRKVFRSEFVKHNFCSMFPAQLYEYAGRFEETHNWQPLREICAVIAIAKIIYDTQPGSNSDRIQPAAGDAGGN